MSSTAIMPNAGTASGARRRWLTIGAELFVLAMALYGGVGLIGNNAIGMLDEWLGGTPFSGWLRPGVLLLVVVALPMGVAMVLELRRSPWAAAGSVVAGSDLIGWIGAQRAVMQRYNFPAADHARLRAGGRPARAVGDQPSPAASAAPRAPTRGIDRAVIGQWVGTGQVAARPRHDAAALAGRSPRTGGPPRTLSPLILELADEHVG
jgi:hypothetical protein